MSGDRTSDDTDMTLEEFERLKGTGLPAKVYTSREAWIEGRSAENTSLRTGVYTVREVCRVLRTSMTSRKVHYWLDKGLIGEPVSWGAPGYATLLSFEQLIRIRTLQRMRDDLKFTLRTAHESLQWILKHLVADGEWPEMELYRAGPRTVGVSVGLGATYQVPTGQGVLEATIPQLELFLRRMRKQWEEGFFRIEGYEQLVSDPGIMAGSPVINGTRVETSFIANLAGEETLAEIKALFPKIDEKAIREAAEFEDVQLVA